MLLNDLLYFITLYNFIDLVMEMIYSCYPFILLLNKTEWKESSVGSDVDGLSRLAPSCSRWPYLQPKPALELEKPRIHRAAQMGHQPKWVPLHDLLRQNTTELISGQTN